MRDLSAGVEIIVGLILLATAIAVVAGSPRRAEVRVRSATPHPAPQETAVAANR
jgi:hypothetical protein